MVQNGHLSSSDGQVSRFFLLANRSQIHSLGLQFDFKRAWWVFGKTKGILNGNDVDILFKKKIQEQISNLYRGMSKSFTNQILNAF